MNEELELKPWEKKMLKLIEKAKEEQEKKS
jgi:hypothetical protein